MNNLHRVFASVRGLRKLHYSPIVRDLYTPDYLETMKSKVPLYDLLNIQMKGYDYPILESYQKYVHNLAKHMDIDMEDCWAVPHQEMQVTTLKPKSDVVNAHYQLKIYQRTVQISDILPTQLSLLVRALEASTPAGVTVEIMPHDQQHENIRYVPDSELKALKQELDDLGGPSKKR